MTERKRQKPKRQERVRRPISVPVSASGQRLPHRAPTPTGTAAAPGAASECAAPASSASPCGRQWGQVQARRRGRAGSRRPSAGTYTSRRRPGPARRTRTEASSA